MRVHHLNCGTMCPPFARLLGQSGSLLGRGRMVCHCLLLETDDGLALVDTGLGTRDIAEPLRRLGAGFVGITGPRLSLAETALAQLEVLGFRSTDVRHVFPTHLDLDHAGGLADFPKATVHIYRPELDAASTRATLNERLRYRSIQWSHDPHWQRHDLQGEAWRGFECVRPVPNMGDQILMVPLLGHTRGHCGIAVETPSGWILHAGDAYYAHSEIHADPAYCPAGIELFQSRMQVDGERRRHNQRRLRELKRAHGDVRIVCAHSAEDFDDAVAAQGR